MRRNGFRRRLVWVKVFHNPRQMWDGDQPTFLPGDRGKHYLAPVATPFSRSGFARARRIMTLAPGVAGDSVHWQDGRIVSVGPAAAIARSLPKGTPQFDLGGALLTPGFTDSHTHFGMWALKRHRVDLTGTDRDQALQRIAGGVPEQGWLLGQGWDANDWDLAPDRQMLDRVVSTPAWFDSLDVHAAWLNSAALDALGITRDTPDPDGGRIARDANGDPTGVLQERAVEMAAALLPVPDPGHLRRSMLSAQQEANRLGITGIHDVGDRHSLAQLTAMAKSGELTLRVLLHPPVAMLPELIAAGVRSGDGHAMLRTGGVKLFLDGSLGSRTAWMLEPYQGSRDRGMPLSSEADATRLMRMAAGAGLALTVHAIGDAAVRRAFDLMEPLPRLSVPHRIEHLQCIHPTDLARSARAGIVASMQPAHLLVDIPLAERHWGARSAGAYAFRTLEQLGTVVAFGSDVPVASLDPRQGIYAALSRTGLDGRPVGGWYADERLDFAAAVSAYTVGPARAAGAADRLGAIFPGAHADFVAWDLDPSAEQSRGEAFLAGQCRLTVVDGRIVWSDLP